MTLLFPVESLFGQNKKVLKKIRNFNFSKARNELREIDDLNLKEQLDYYLNINKLRGYNPISPPKTLNFKTLTNKDSLFVISINYLNIGLYNFYYEQNAKQDIFNFYNSALQNALLTKNKPLICEVVKAILNYYATIISIEDFSYQKYLDIYESNIYDSLESKIFTFFKYILDFEKSNDTEYIEKLLPNIFKLSKETLPKPYKGRILVRLGNYHQFGTKDKDSASYYYKKSISLFSNPSIGYLIEQYIKSKSNYARLLTSFNRYRYSNKILDSLDINYRGKLHEWNKVYINYYKAVNYKHLKQFDSAYIYLDKSRLGEYSLNQKNHLQVIKDINTKFLTERKEKENLQLKQKNLINQQKLKQNRNLLFGSMILIFFVITIGFLSIKNSRRKRLLAEQEKNLEQQKNLTLLKEQEITAINAMIDGQEKERIRIAEDLHDNIGSVLATLKLHFENLQLNRNKKQFDQNILFQKTETLIDEAYLKIRSIAHAKNSGVIANQGLLVAVKLMAEKISSANKVQINVIDFGLNNRLENSLEITLFRIIQELATNVIKHAHATEVNINISQFNDHINIIVEDNGIGFIYNTIERSQGMGLGSIEKRVEYLAGTFEVDSTINKGTSIIIDFPINNT
ncbi:Histidine kinase [Tenacibaculum sp. MAR_2009_124]|uniref:sensor histidine kinase n=1 Tax=Tenacibaculum sp. MAR_2009_124 TaxID=1250059 RepID=UPI00089AF2D3|nr:sensor histidine kinase [Tenacibaculum sp. MAR_2009_124]SEC93524.1 Histidine kinase [Tenacibaculum sp. MAR_2009_124]